MLGLPRSLVVSAERDASAILLYDLYRTYRGFGRGDEECPVTIPIGTDANNLFAHGELVMERAVRRDNVDRSVASRKNPVERVGAVPKRNRRCVANLRTVVGRRKAIGPLLFELPIKTNGEEFTSSQMGEAAKRTLGGLAG